MEPPSAKLSVIFQNERKLKQATLPFEIMKISPKTDSPLMKRKKFSDCNKEKDVKIVEIIEETMVNDEKYNSPSLQMEVQETASEAKLKVKYEVQNNVMETESRKQENSDCSDVVLLENSEEACVDKKVRELISEGNTIEDDNLKTNKRKFEGAEKVKEQKPPKRAKLIHSTDKTKKNQTVDISNVNSVNSDIGNNPTNREKNVDDNRKCNSSSRNEMNQLEARKNFAKDHAVEVAKQSREVLCDDNPSSKDIITKFDNMDMDSSSSVELLMPVESCENIAQEYCTNPGMRSENCSPSGRVAVKQLTPRQLERKAEMAKRKEEIQQERERKKKEKDRMKQEKEEEKARLKQEKEEVKKKIKEEKEKKRQAEIEIKNEEKRKKEEEKRKKEEEKQEEKRKKEEQKLEDKRKKEEMMKKKEEEQEMQKKKITKEAEVFSSFFKKYDMKTPTAKADDVSSNEVVFMPFAVRADMRLAPINRNPMDEERRSKFEELYQTQTTEKGYLEELRSGVSVPKKSDNTWPLEEKYGDVIVLDEGLDLKDEVTPEPEKKFNDRRPKLLQFNENRRPPYWGTWRKKSKNVRPRNPLGKDEIFDYEVDSDEEWEEEEPGESLHGSDDEKESEDEYEVDNDFFVPHGYLSDDENPEDETISPETQKAKLKLLGEQFDMERNEKTKLLKPILLGCVWFSSDSDEPASANPSVVKFLNRRKAIPWTDIIPIPVLQDENTDPAEVALPESSTPTSNKETFFPESAIPDLITLIYGSINSRKTLAKTFLNQWNKKQGDSIGEGEVITGVLNQARIAKKIKELAKWEEFPEEGPCNGKLCWYVKREIREKFGLADLAVPSKVDDTDRELDACKKVSPSLITKFTKVLTQDEKKKQITKDRKSSVSKPLTESTPNSPKQVTPLKCIQKLKNFWPKPSIMSKYTPTSSVDTSEVMIIDPPEKQEEKTVEVDTGKEESRREATPPPIDGSSEECLKIEPKPAVRKRVAILFSAPRGCEIVKEALAMKQATSVNDVNVEGEISK